MIVKYSQSIHSVFSSVQYFLFFCDFVLSIYFPFDLHSDRVVWRTLISCCQQWQRFAATAVTLNSPTHHHHHRRSRCRCRRCNHHLFSNSAVNVVGINDTISLCNFFFLILNFLFWAILKWNQMQQREFSVKLETKNG